MILKLSWRNLWRQKRRTILTALAIALALFLSLLMRSFQEGQYTSNIENLAKSGMGMIQLQNPKFHQSESIDDLLPSTDAFIAPAKTINAIDHLLPRVNSYSLAAAGERSKGVMINGIDPQLENAYTGLAHKLIMGEYFTENEKVVLVAEGVAKYFNLKVGDEIVFYGQGYRGQTAAGLYTIKGILKFPLKALNNSQVYMPIKLAHQLFSTQGQVTSWVLSVNSIRLIDKTVETLKRVYPEQVSVRDWKNLSPELEQSIVLDRVGGQIMMYLLYGIVGFGLFATLLMMTLERQREFSVMLATGLVRSKLLLMVTIESVIIGLLGVVIGASLALPIIFYYYFNPIRLTGAIAEQMLEMGYEPIMPVSLSPELLFNQIFIVLSLLVICLIYPMWRIYSLELVSGLKGGSHAN
jgi:ABC-type lipoprotein release transport system permease subunit